MNDFYNDVTTNMGFLKELVNLREFVNKLGVSSRIKVFNEHGEELFIDLYKCKFTAKKRKGIEPGKTYFIMRGSSYIYEEDRIYDGYRLYLDNIIESFWENMPEEVSFTTPVILDDNNGFYYQVIGLGFDKSFNIAIWCKRIIR